MRHGKGNLDSKRPRYHPVIAWEANNLTNDFVDINRVALDNRYGKVGASLYKRRNGTGPTDGSTPGLFGTLVDDRLYKNSPKRAFFTGVLVTGGAYALTDFWLNKGKGLEGWQRRMARQPLTIMLGLVAAFALVPSE